MRSQLDDGDDAKDDEIMWLRYLGDMLEKEQALSIYEEEEELEFDPENFTLTEKDEYAIAIVRKVVRLLLSYPSITPKDVFALGKALYALGRMPLSTPGVDCTFNLSSYSGDEDRNATEYIDFAITSRVCAIQRGATSYTRGAGGDTSSHNVWAIEVGSNMRDDKFDLNEILDEVSDFLNSDCEIRISDLSCNDFHMEDEAVKTEKPKSGRPSIEKFYASITEEEWKAAHAKLDTVYKGLGRAPAMMTNLGEQKPTQAPE